MYRIEGELTTARDPESLIGNFGVLYSDQRAATTEYGLVQAAESTRIAYTGSEIGAHLVASGLRLAHRTLRGVEVERITSYDQALKYSVPMTQTVDMSRTRAPHYEDVLWARVPENHVLLGGALRIWKEFRFPTPVAYVSATGRLLADVVFNRATGWRHRADVSEGSRRQLGLTVLGYGASIVKSHVENLRRVS